MSEQKRNICEINQNTTWRLVDVQEHDGNSKDDEPLERKFPFSHGSYTIQPGEAKYIMPHK